MNVVLHSRPDPPGEDVGDVLAVDCCKSGHEAMIGTCQTEVIPQEDSAEVGDDGFRVERSIREANLVAPAGSGRGRVREGWLALHQPAVRRQARVRIVETKIVIGDANCAVGRHGNRGKESLPVQWRNVEWSLVYADRS